MSNPRQIVDERLARGEITLIEHQELVAVLSSASLTPPPARPLTLTPETEAAEITPPPLPPVPSASVESAVAAVPVSPEPGAKKPIWKNPFAIGAAIGTVIMVIAANNNQGTVRVNNARMTGIIFATVSGTLINDGPKGDVWVWVVQEGKNLCPRRTYMTADSSQRFSYRCEGGSPWLDGSVRGSKKPPSDVARSDLGL